MRLLARCLLLCGVLPAYLGCSPSDPLKDVRSLHERGRFAESLEPTRVLLEEAPDDPELNHLYGVALMRTGQQSLARWPLRRAMEDPEWLTASATRLASSLLALGNHEAAIEALNEVLAREPDNTQALLLRSRAKILSRKDYEGALADVDRIDEIDPDTPASLVPRAAALLGLERLDEVAEVLAELERRFRDEELDPGQTAHYCLTRATFAQESGDLELATQRFEGCLSDMPDNDQVVLAVIGFHDNLGRADRALEIIRSTLERTPEATLYRTALAERLERRGRVEEAERLLEDGLELGGAPEFVKWANLSAHYQRQQNYSKAIETIAKAVEAAPDPPPAMLFEYAEVLVVGGELERALEVAEQIDVAPIRSLVRGRVHFERKEYEAALEHFSAGLLLWPDNAVARYLSARSAEQIGDFERAIGEYRYAVRAAPGATDARFRLVKLRIAEGDLNAARTEALQAAGRADPDAEAELAVLEAMAEVTPLEQQSPLLARLSRNPAVAGRALTAVARGIAEREGSAVAANYIRRARGLDLTQPAFAEALDALVGYLIENGSGEEARDQVAAARAAHPDSAILQAIEAGRLEKSGAAREQVRDSYARALELDEREPRALEGLARLALVSGEVDEAADWYRKAAAADPSQARYRRKAAELLLAQGRSKEAEDELEQLLGEHPFDASAALQLGNLHLEAGGREDLKRALDLGERARRFRGGAEAEALVSTARRRLSDSS
jgi:tetratricopeptide (TPR) repeat protein